MFGAQNGQIMVRIQTHSEWYQDEQNHLHLIHKDTSTRKIFPSKS